MELESVEHAQRLVQPPPANKGLPFLNWTTMRQRKLVGSNDPAHRLNIEKAEQDAVKIVQDDTHLARSVRSIG